MSENKLVQGRNLEALADHSVEEVNGVIEEIIANKSVSKKMRRQAVALVVNNQPYPTREFDQFKLWNQDIRDVAHLDDCLRFVKGMASVGAVSAVLGWLIIYGSNGSAIVASISSLAIVAMFALAALVAYGSNRSDFRLFTHERHDLTLEEFREQQRVEKIEQFRETQQKHQEELAVLGLSDVGGPSVSEVKQDFADAQARIASYELDMEKALSRPAFNDISVDAVAEMVVQLKKCRRMVSDMSSMTAADTATEVDLLWVKIGAAETAAKRIAWSTVSVEEQKDLRVALDLVKQANDPGNPEELRRNLYARLKKVVARLDAGGITIPAKMTEQIEHRASSQIAPFEKESGKDVVYQ